MTKFSYSRVNCYKSCPYLYKLGYIDKLRTIPNYDANNALILGSAMHTGIEKDVDAALAQYYSNFPAMTDLQINEAIKLAYIIPLAKKVIPAGKFEVKIETDSFIGFIDLLVPKGNNHFDIYDFKYSNNVDGYMKSAQLHIYKYFYELTHPGHVIDNLYYLFLPKTQIRQKNSKTEVESLSQFRERILATLGQSEVRKVKVDYDPQKVRDYLATVEEIKAATEYPKNCTRLCDWCDYKKYCTKGDTYMFIPTIEPPATRATMKKILWFYGEPCSGKTTLADQFPNPIMLNTDGNRVENGKAPVIAIRDIITKTGNAVKVTPAWEVFKNTVAWLETKPGNYRTIILDLLEDTRRDCRLAMYKNMGIKHEHDAGYGKGYDMVENELLSTWIRFLNLDYEYIILISHEDSSKSINTAAGSSITCLAPKALPEKLAKTIWGRVTAIGRVINTGKRRYISFDTEGVNFGGAHVKLHKMEVPLSFEGVQEALGINNNPTTETPAEVPTRRRAVETTATNN